MKLNSNINNYNIKYAPFSDKNLKYEIKFTAFYFSLTVENYKCTVLITICSGRLIKSINKLDIYPLFRTKNTLNNIKKPDFLKM